MGKYTLDLQVIDRRQIARVGGKGANLGELSRIEGLRVPAGFCITTDAFQWIMEEATEIHDRLERLSRVQVDDREAIRALSTEIRQSLESVVIPDDLATAIIGPLVRLGEQSAYAVRSSATAEDLPSASFAGQQDTCLNVIGRAAILASVIRCWASLFTERAVTYRLRNGIDQRRVQMAVVVQQMVFPDASGIVFTADPVTGNRKVASVEASFGLGEALVSGLVNADVFKARADAIVARTIGSKHMAVLAEPLGGTRQQAVAPTRQEQPALTDEQVLRLARLGRRIEAHFGSPQDIEWCLVDGEFQFVQSRPITTLFPIPVANDGENHVYLSVGHQQMMTDAMEPLGVSVRQVTGIAVFHAAGGRVFVDVSRALASPAGRAGLLGMAGKSDPLTGDALETIMQRDFIPLRPDTASAGPPSASTSASVSPDPAIVAALIARSQASIAALKRDIQGRSGSELLDFIMADFQEMKRLLSDPLNHQAIMAVTEATWWLNDKLEEWLGEKSVADTLSQSVPGNVTSEMGLELMDVADVIRPHPEVVAFLQHTDDEHYLNKLPKLEGGREARDAIAGWLAKYGMRCVGEIDITRPRWSERPSTLLPMLLGNVAHFEPGEAKRRFAQGLEAASRKEADVLARLRTLPNGEDKARETKRMIDRVRAFAGYREYPKYGMVCRYAVHKEALLREAERLAEEGVLREKEDIFYLSFEELQDVVRAKRVDDALIARRKDEFRWYQTLTPPRVLTSEGEAVNGSYHRNGVPAGAVVGLPVSAGSVEGRARVILDLADADLEPGDILVTTYTDPSWTPVFVAIAGLVTEVGGLMTHGAVIAREYGLPAVVGVEHATRLIEDGQRIRVHGTEGYVEILR
jgi:pyruvate,water dikinase